MKTGRTLPNLISCEREDGTYVDAVVKCSAKTMQGVRDLAVEAVCGMIAKDLDLPVPEFFAVQVDPEFVETIREPIIRDLFSNSDTFAFGSAQLPTGFAVWGTDQSVPEALCQTAAEIYTFDAIVINGDRRPENPNCMFSGSEIAIIDHELCFSQELFWRAPWIEGGFDSRRQPQQHIFAKPRLTSCPADLNRFEDAWNTIDEGRVDAYFRALPPSWKLENHEADRIRGIILDSRANIHEVVERALGALR
ncbi:HipA family kinase [Allopusillimonas soli]|nr:HipA family kinase [Allopusillimonas soli]